MLTNCCSTGSGEPPASSEPVKEDKGMSSLGKLLLFVLGFAAYPLLFIPLMVKFCPNTFATYLEYYADYLRLWGF